MAFENKFESEAEVRVKQYIWAKFVKHFAKYSLKISKFFSLAPPALATVHFPVTIYPPHVKDCSTRIED